MTLFALGVFVFLFVLASLLWNEHLVRKDMKEQNDEDARIRQANADKLVRANAYLERQAKRT